MENQVSDAVVVDAPVDANVAVEAKKVKNKKAKAKAKAKPVAKAAKVVAAGRGRPAKFSGKDGVQSVIDMKNIVRQYGLIKGRELICTGKCKVGGEKIQISVPCLSVYVSQTAKEYPGTGPAVILQRGRPKLEAAVPAKKGKKAA